MKKYILIAFVIFFMFVSVSFSFGISRDDLDHVEIISAVKAELCRIENPGCEEPQGDEPIETPTWDVRVNISAECLRAKMEELSCQPEKAEMILGEFKVFIKSDKTGGRLYSGGMVLVVDDNVYGPGMTSAGYYSNRSQGGWFVMDDPNHPEKFKGLRYLAFCQPRRFDPDIPPYGYERVIPGYILIYYDEDGTLSVYAHLKENYYKMTTIKKKIENKTWTPPPEPENRTEVEIPRKIDVPTPIPPPPVYLPGMPESADPNKEHVIPNCNSQGASVCRQDEECPDKWIKAKEERCCSVICTPVGKKEVPPGLEKKNETENKTKEEINTTLALAAELGLPEGYNAEFLLKPDLLSPLFITATSDDQLLVAEHYGSRLLRINPLNAKIDVLYNLPHGEWNALLSDGADGAYLQIRGNLAHIDGNGNYTLYYQHPMNPAALGPSGEIYGYTKSDVFVLNKSEEPKIIATGFTTIFDLVRDKEGNLYVSDWDLGTITRINPDGTKQLLTSSVNQKDPIDLGFAPDGTMYVNEGTPGLSRIDKNNGILTKIGWFGGYEGMHPTDFAFLSNSKAYFVDPTHNNIFSADFKKEEMGLVIRGAGNSRALDVGPDGAVYIGDNNGYPFYRSRILRIQLNGSAETYADNLDAINDLSFTQNGSMFVITNYVEKGKYNINSVLLITPEHEVKTLVSWDTRLNPAMRDLWSISVDPNTGLAIAYDKINNELISIDENGKFSVLPNSFDFEEMQSVYLDHATDGTLYAIEVNREGFGIGPIIERNIIQFDENGNPEIIANFDHIGSGTCENLAIAPDKTIYVVGIKGNAMSLGKITNDGENILLSDKLPIDPLSVAVDSEGNIFVTCSAGLLRIWK